MSDPKKKEEINLIGIDFNNLEDFSGSIRKVNSTQDMSIINEIAPPHNQIKKILENRKISLKSLEKEWIKGNISQTIKDLTNLNDKGVFCDFFNSAFMCNGYNKDYLKIENYVMILPLIENLVNAKYESCFRCGIKMVCMLFDMYSNIILQCKKSMNTDKKTMDNYDKLVQFFDKIPKSENVKKRDLNSDKNLGALLEEMKDFCEECRKK